MRKDILRCRGEPLTLFYKESTSNEKIEIGQLMINANPKDLKEIPDFVHKYDNSKETPVNIFKL